MTIPKSVRARYALAASESDVARLLSDRPERVALLASVADVAIQVFGPEAQLSLIVLEKVARVDPVAIEPHMMQLMIKINTALRDQALDRAISAFDQRYQEEFSGGGVLWTTDPGRTRVTAKRVKKILHPQTRHR
jgi:hypothetical protein